MTNELRFVESIQGGSLGKGTAVLGESDVDVVLFINGFTTLRDFQRHRENLLVKLEGFMRQIGSDYDVDLKGRTRRAIKFTFKCDRDSPETEVDLLPAFGSEIGEG